MNNLKKVIALSVMVIMVISIAPFGVSAMETSDVYWDSDIAQITDELLGYGNQKEAPIEDKEIAFVNGGAVSGNVSFAGDVVIDDLANFTGVPTDDTRKGTAIKFTTNSSSSTDSERTEMVLDFTNSEYSDIVKIDFDVLFQTNAEHLYIDMAGDGGSTNLWWHDSYNLYSANGIALNSSNQAYSGAGRTANVWEHWTITLNMKDSTMNLAKNSSTFAGASNAEDNTAYIGITGKMKRITFYRANYANESGIYLDNISVRGYKEKPSFVDADENPAPTTGISATRELNVKLDRAVLVDDAFVGNSNNPFYVKKVSDESVISVHTVTPVGDENRQFKLYLDSKLEDNTQYKLVAENVKDSTGKTATAEYTFTTTAAPSNFGIYKMGFVDGSGNPKYDFNVGDTVGANLVVTNTTDAPQSVTGAVVIYKQTENGIEMCGIQEYTQEIAAGGNFDFSSNLSTTVADTTASTATGFFAKTFAWKGDLTGAKFIPFDTTSYIGN